MTTDKIDKAINGQQDMENRMRVPVTISSTGRIALIDVPADLSDQELLEITGWIAVNLAQHMWATRAKPSPIQIVRGVLPS